MSLSFRQIGDALPKNQIGVLPWYPRGATDYDDKVIALSPLEYWPINDAVAPAGLVAPGIVNGFDGLYFGVGVTYGVPGPGDGAPAISLDGTGNVCFFSAGLAALWNAAELTIGAFVQIAASQWTDSTVRYFNLFGTDAAADFSSIRKSTANNRAEFLHRGGGSVDTRFHTFSPQELEFFHIAITVSESANAGAGRARLYINGEQSGADVTPIGADAGGGLLAGRATAGTTSCVGAFSPHIGKIARVFVMDREATAAEMLSVGVI